ncbi:unnamed protein product [Acanthosepion pharaonis]|uniref:Uncharacterized protein n=1 Tax=Acanthosepion pharaonis TaxID=158019 RepID=A0A812BTJ5_ACAPH|nr:unnamed protein product [Sepia pharaonis]
MQINPFLPINQSHSSVIFVKTISHGSYYPIDIIRFISINLFHSVHILHIISSFSSSFDISLQDSYLWILFILLESFNPSPSIHICGFFSFYLNHSIHLPRFISVDSFHSTRIIQSISLDSYLWILFILLESFNPSPSIHICGFFSFYSNHSIHLLDSYLWILFILLESFNPSPRFISVDSFHSTRIIQSISFDSYLWILFILLESFNPSPRFISVDSFHHLIHLPDSFNPSP